MKYRLTIVFACLCTFQSLYAQKVYLGWSIRPGFSLNTLELNEDYLLSDYNWRVYEVHKRKQVKMSGSFAVGPTLLVDLFRVNLTVGSILSYRAYDFEAKRLTGKDEFELESSKLGETLIEVPMLAGITLFSGKPLKLYIEGGINYNVVLSQTEDEPLLSGGDIFRNYLMDGKNYSDYVGGAGVRFKNMYITIRRYIRGSDLHNGKVKSSFWTFNFLITMKSAKYSKHHINL